MVNKRLPPNERKDEILKAAAALAVKHGYNRITRDAIALQAKVSMGLVTHHFSTMNQLRRELMRYAVHNELLEIIAQGLSARDPHARKASPELQERATSSIIRR